jgi:hypothetical protein
MADERSPDAWKIPPRKKENVTQTSAWSPPPLDAGPANAPERRRWKASIIGPITLTAVVTVYVVILFVRHQTSPPHSIVSVAATPEPTASTPSAGRIIVNTIPAGASVYIDGANEGRTPIVLRNVSEGVHQIRLEALGYEDTPLVAEVKPGAATDLGTVHLPAKPQSSVIAEPTTSYQTPPSPPVSVPPMQPVYDYRGFVLQHLQKCSNRDIAGVVADYTDVVDYYENGFVGRSFIAQDREKYAASWPALSIQLTSEIAFDASNAPRVIVTFNYTFEARNGRKASRGSAQNTWTLLQTADGLKINAEKQSVTARSRSR